MNPIHVSVLITSYLEPLTVGRAIERVLVQVSSESEILVICPDPETIAVVLSYAQQDKRVKHIQDERQGKPAALNLGLAQAQHEIVVLTDGDVYVSENAMAELLQPFADVQAGAVTGRPISESPRETMLGFWSHLLVDAAHATRQQRHELGKFLLCSGYLFAYRRALFPVIPVDALAEDAVISHKIAEQGYKISYAPQALVFVKYPTTYADWLKQKVRSAGGYAQDYIAKSAVQMRSARLEIRDGTGFALRYGQNFREKLWTMCLFIARVHLWLLVYWNVRVRKRSLVSLWQRVTTTK
jgi:cellulose synthase/poly-beta-1,6-N-acetylglucosamine synthase-like glycosyltransferase